MVIWVVVVYEFMMFYNVEVYLVEGVWMGWNGFMLLCVCDFEVVVRELVVLKFGDGVMEFVFEMENEFMVNWIWF